MDLTQDIRELTYRPDFAADRVNVFCMYCWAPPWVDEEQVLIDKESQLGGLRKLAEAYGPYSVIISDMSEFFNRLDQAVKRPDNRIAQYMRATVQYELTDVYPVELGRMIDLAFHKERKVCVGTRISLSVYCRTGDSWTVQIEYRQHSRHSVPYGYEGNLRRHCDQRVKRVLKCMGCPLKRRES